jgi:hypothetical protein
MSAAPISRKAAIRAVLDGWSSQNWSDAAGAALSVVDAHARGAPFKPAVPEEFCVKNDCSPQEVAQVASNALGAAVIAKDRPTVITPEEIDSFSRVASISASDVASIARPIPIPEREVKRLLLGILGEPEVPGDWGGERSDAFSTHVYLDGERITSSFVLKGPSKAGELTPADYGKNGDQLQRSFTQPASLHVIQANAQLATSIYELANGLVLDARAKGDARAVATIWDGTDTARILVAYGLIDPSDGRIL